MLTDEERQARKKESKRKYRETHRVQIAEYDREYSRQCRAAHPEKVRKANNRWRVAHLESGRKRSRKWRLAHPEKARESDRKQRAANLGRHREYLRKYRAANPERARGYGRKYYATHEEAGRARVRRYQKANPQKMAAKQNKRRALKAGNGGSYTAEELRVLCERYGNQCIGPGPHEGDLEADHVVPIISGGMSDIMNIQPLCGACNRRKGTKTIDYRVSQEL